MSFGRYTILKQATLLVVYCFLTIAVWSQPTTLHSFPNRWGFPSPFEYTSTIVDTASNLDPVVLIHIDITVSNNSLDLKLAGFERCYVEFGDPMQIIPMTAASVGPSMVRGFVNFAGISISASTEYDLRWVCDSMHLVRPESLYGAETGLETDITVKVSIYDSDNRLETLESLHMITIKDDPTITHRYSWVESSGSLLAISSTFYRPATLHENTFYITHPLLDVNRISSMHVSQDDGRLEDLHRNYGLLRSNQRSKLISCVSSDPGLNADLIYVDSEGDDGMLVPKLEIPSTAPLNEEYICTFTIHTQPGVVATLLSSSPFQGAVNIQHGTDPNTTYPADLQHPRVVPDYSDSLDVPPLGIHQWVSFHHHMDSTTEFEIGLAMTDRYYDMNTQETKSYGDSQITQLTCMIYSLSAAIIHPGGSMTEEFSLAEWSPTIACRDHTTLEYPDDVSLDDGIIHLVKERFSIFGQTCRIRLRQRPHGVAATGALAIRMASLDDHINIDDSSYILSFNAMHDYDRPYGPILYHDTSHVTAAWLPPPTPILFTTITEDHRSYAVGEFDFQYLLPYQIPYDSDYMSISFFFADQVAIPLSLADVNLIWVTVTAGNHVIYDDDASVYFASTRFDPTIFNADAVSTIFQHGQPLRSPQFNLAFAMPVLDASQPLRIKLKIPRTSSTDMGEMQMYPVLMPSIQALTSTYSPMYGIFTAPRATPLTGYSYRCVTWDRMAASYVYGRTAPAVTDENSVPCPSYTLPLSGDVVTELDVNDTTIWRRVEYASTVEMAKSATDFVCFYERAAVCVTPSTTVEGAYDTHPLADCPSFLGTTHMIPCNQVDHDNTAIQPPPRPPYSLALTKTSQITIIQQATDDFPRRMINIFWNYIGDPHLTMTVAVAMMPAGSVTPPAWVVISRDIPAYLSLEGPRSSYPKIATMTLPFPNISLATTGSFHVRLVVNNAPQIESTEIVTLPSDENDDDDNYDGVIFINCTEKFHKSIDPSTQLCSCRPGYRSNVPNGIEDPFLHPDAFFCTQRCNQQAGHTWSLVNNRCEDSAGDFQCENYGVKNPSTQRCQCLEGFFGEYCQHTASDKDHLCAQLECVAGHTAMLSGDAQCIPAETAEQGSSGLRCNCLPEYTGERCEHERVCGVQQCINGRLMSPTGKPEECKCECNSTNITGTACNQCTLGCRNGGVANTRCSACQCPAGYIGTTCTIPVWYHTFTLRNLPQHIVELILGTTASDKEEMAILQQTMVKYLLEDYSRVLSETFIVVDGNNSNNDNDDTRIRVRVELSQFQTVIPPANPNAPYVHIQLMLYPADMTEEMLAYALQHGLDFDWSRVTDNLEFFRKFLREQGIVDGNDDLTPEIDDPGCTTRECRDKIIDDDSSNSSFIVSLSTSLMLVILMVLF